MSEYVGPVEILQTNPYLRKYEHFDSESFITWYTILMWDNGVWRQMIDFTTANKEKRDYDFENLIHGILNHGSSLGRVIDMEPPHLGDHKAGEGL